MLTGSGAVSPSLLRENALQLVIQPDVHFLRLHMPDKTRLSEEVEKLVLLKVL